MATYNITYELYWWTNDVNNPPTYDSDNLPITLYSPTKPDTTFVGWATSKETTPQLNYTIEPWTTGDIKLYAYFSPVAYKVYHIIERANRPWVYTLYEVEHLEWIPWQYTNAQPKNYTWFYQDGTITQKIIASDWSTDVYIYYTRYNYTINFDSNWWSSVASITAKYGAPLTPPSDPTKSWDTFIGWVPSFPTAMPLGWADLVAAWNNGGIKGIMMNGKYILRKYAYNNQTYTLDEVQKVMLNWKKIRPLSM